MVKTGYVVMAVLCILIAAIQIRFLFLPIESASPDMVHHVAGRPMAFWTHVTAAAVAMVLGVAQFSTRLRNARPGLHRWTGRTYVTAVVFGAPSGLVLALNANGGLVTRTGFAFLAVFWLIATLVALYRARARQFVLHRRWMIRSFALTLAAVSLRLQVPILTSVLGTDYSGVLPLIAWSCWVPNLLLAEWLIRQRPGLPAAA